MSAALDEVIGSAPVVFFDMSSCPYCRKAEKALRSAGIEFNLVPIAQFKPALRAKTGKTSAPSVWVNGEYVGGCNDGTESWHGVMPMLKSGKMQEMLG
jgi:glutaredoxin 3